MLGHINISYLLDMEERDAKGTAHLTRTYTHTMALTATRAAVWRVCYDEAQRKGTLIRW